MLIESGLGVAADISLFVRLLQSIKFVSMINDPCSPSLKVCLFGNFACDVILLIGQN